MCAQLEAVPQTCDGCIADHCGDASDQACVQEKCAEPCTPAADLAPDAGTDDAP